MFFLSFGSGFLNSASDVAGFSDANTNFILVVADSNKSLEAHTATTAHGARNAVNVNSDGVKLFGGGILIAITIAATTAAVPHCATIDVFLDFGGGDAVAHFEVPALLTT